VAPKKFWRQILTSKTKENNKISLKDCDSYLKKLYDSPDVTNNTQNPPTFKEVFLLEDIDLVSSA